MLGIVLILASITCNEYGFLEKVKGKVKLIKLILIKIKN